MIFQRSLAALSAFIFVMTTMPHAMAQSVVPNAAPNTPQSAKQTPASADGSEDAKPPVARAERALWVAHVLRSRGQESKIASLGFPVPRIPVYLFANKGDLRPLVEIRGQYARSGWTLFVQGDVPVKPGATPDEFVLHAYLNARINEVGLTAKGPNGEIETETVYLFAPEAQEFKIVSPWESAVVSLGVTDFGYDQSSFGTLGVTSALLSIDYATPDRGKKYGAIASLDISFFPLRSSPIESNPTFIDARIDGSWILNFHKDVRLRTRALVGMSSVSVLSNGGPYGFANLIAPEIGFKTQWFEGASETFSGEFRLVPLDNIGLMTQRGLVLNATWSRLTSSLKRFEIGGELSHLAYSPSEGTEITLRVVSIKAGFSF